jgi:ATP-binding cassette subfamily B protein
MGSLSWLNSYIARYKHLFIPGLLFAALSAAFSVSVPVIVRQVVDAVPRFVALFHLHGSNVRPMIWNEVFWTLLFYAGVVVALALMSGLFTFLMRQTIVVASRHIEYDLRETLYGHLQKLPPEFYQSLSTGDVMTRATSDIEQVRRYAGPAFMYMASAITRVTLALSFMVVISPTLALWALAPMPLLAVSVYFVARMEFSRSQAIQKQYSVVTSRVQEALAGIRVVKAYARQRAEGETFAGESRHLMKRNLSLALVSAAWRPVFTVLIGLSTILVVWQGGRLVAEDVITVGNIAEFIIYVALMTWPVASLGFIISMVQRAAASMDRLATILGTEPSIRDTDATDQTVDRLEGAIAFEGVSYAYAGPGEDVLKEVSFSLEPGQMLGIVGRTGSGKTTLVRMIPRLLDPSAGTVRVDGRDVRRIPLDTLRGGIGYVPQDVFLFSETIAENIAFGAPHANRADVEDATREADLLGNIEGFPDGFETFVGERGITLSGGQKQRTAIARALVRNPRILIFDDALSAVDTNTERRILGNLKARVGGQTLVVVSHRISAVQDADLILVLEDGCVAERGTHDELVARAGIYAEMHGKQLLQQEIEEL